MMSPFLGLFILLMLASGPAFAIGEGGYDGGCCGFPPELEGQAGILERSFASTVDDTLRRQRWAGSLCVNHPCGDITEEQAKLLLNDLATQNHRTTDRWFAVVGAVSGILGTIFGGIALYQTAQANRMSRESNERSVKSEMRLERIEKQET